MNRAEQNNAETDTQASLNHVMGEISDSFHHWEDKRPQCLLLFRNGTYLQAKSNIHKETLSWFQTLLTDHPQLIFAYLL